MAEKEPPGAFLFLQCAGRYLGGLSGFARVEVFHDMVRVYGVAVILCRCRCGAWSGRIETEGRQGADPVFLCPVQAD